jgi:hypothetical protein
VGGTSNVGGSCSSTGPTASTAGPSVSQMVAGVYIGDANEWWIGDTIYDDEESWVSMVSNNNDAYDYDYDDASGNAGTYTNTYASVNAGTYTNTDASANVCTNVGEPKHVIMMDSGSDEHCWPMSGHNLGTKVDDVKPKLRTITGEYIKAIGRRRMLLDIPNDNQHVKASIPFTVGDFKKKIISPGKLVREGDIVHLEAGRSYWQRGGLNGPWVDLTLTGNTFYLDADVIGGVSDDEDEEIPQYQAEAIPAVVAPPEIEDVVPPLVAHPPLPDVEQLQRLPTEEDPLRDTIAIDVPPTRARALTSGGRVADMHARCKELQIPWYGTKTQLWERIMKRESELSETVNLRAYLEDRAVRLQQGQEPYVPIVLPTPQLPTQLEKETHEATHLPMEKWCEHCQRGKAQQAPHFTVEPARRIEVQPLVEFDFMFMNSEAKWSDSEAWETASYVTLIGVDYGTRYPLALALNTKQVTPYLVKATVAWLDRLGHTTLTIKSDNEPTMAQFLEKVKLERKLPTFLKFSPRYSSASHGLVENMIKQVQGQARTLRSQMESMYAGLTLDPTHGMWPWMIRHVAFLIARYHVKANGRTAYSDQFQHGYNGSVVPMGEVVLHAVPYSQTGHQAGGKRRNKADLNWHRAVWIGKSEISDEHMVATPDGVVTTRTVKRLTPPTCYDLPTFAGARGLPWSLGIGARGRPRRRERALPKVIGRDGYDGPGGGYGPDGPEGGDGPDRPGDTENQGGPSSSSRGRPRTDDTTPFPQDDDDDQHPTGRAPEPKRFKTNQPTIADQPMSPTISDGPTTDEARSFWEDRELWARDNDGPSKRAKLKHEAESVGVIAAIQTMDEPYPELVDPWDLEHDSHADGTEDEITNARRAHILKLESYGTFEPVDKAEVMRNHGRVISTRWVSSGTDGKRKERFVAREYKHLDPTANDFFAATTGHMTARIIDMVALQRHEPTFTMDVEGAYLHVPEREEVYCIPPQEWTDMQANQRPTIWKLHKVLNGRRAGAQWWLDLVQKVLTDMGFEQHAALPFFYVHRLQGLTIEVHMDDFYGTGPTTAIAWFRDEIGKANWTTKHFNVHGTQKAEYTHLRRHRRRTNEGIWISPNPTHRLEMIRLLGLETAKPAPTPAIPDKADETDDTDIDDEQKAIYRTVVGIALYDSSDRPECQYAVRELGRKVREPKLSDWTKLKRYVRYLIGCKTYEALLPTPTRSTATDELVVNTDSDWAKDKLTRKSVSCGIIRWCGGLIASWSRGQTAISLSSGEAEWYALSTGISEAIAIRDLLKFIGFTLTIKALVDASAAIGMANRLGVGRLRHLDCRTLWVQVLCKNKEVRVCKVKGTSNVADIGTKVLSNKELSAIINALGIVRLA